ncbi:MAG TPA: amino acid racemase [Candidatus Krumholzibacteria bacterium]|nr:amino acid racemase [Candidatus Krumholzibacteria bacterium]
MKTAGIIGGLGPESTLDYYRLFIDIYRGRVQDGSYPSLLINSVDLKRLTDLITANRLAEIADYLVVEIKRLAAAGADFGLISANTPHIVFDQVAPRSPIPLLSIVDAACDAARARGIKRPALLGTRFTMQGRFYPEPFRAAGIDLVLPTADEQAFVHDKYMNELLLGTFGDDTRRKFSALIEQMKTREGIDGLILAGTELPLLLRDAPDPGIPVLDTARIHVDAAVSRLLA